MLHYTKLKLLTSAVRRIPSTINPKTLTQHKSGMKRRQITKGHTEEVVKKWSYICKELPLSRRLEFEADYIGLLMMASPGYDPRVAPQFWSGEANLNSDDGNDHESMHPSDLK